MKEFLLYIALGFIAINIFGIFLCTGESYPVPKPSEYVKYTTRSAYP